MTWWYILGGYALGALIIDLIIVLDEYELQKRIESVLNPVIIYKEYNVNIFGCIMLTIGGHLLCPWIAPFYWFYKLCTVGRR
jgi:hypothetical protein